MWSLFFIPRSEDTFSTGRSEATYDSYRGSGWLPDVAVPNDFDSRERDLWWPATYGGTLPESTRRGCKDLAHYGFDQYNVARIG